MQYLKIKRFIGLVVLLACAGFAAVASQFRRRLPCSDELPLSFMECSVT